MIILAPRVEQYGGSTSDRMSSEEMASTSQIETRSDESVLVRHQGTQSVTCRGGLCMVKFCVNTKMRD